jgi:hypothetical protein
LDDTGSVTGTDGGGDGGRGDEIFGRTEVLGRDDFNGLDDRSGKESVRSIEL